MTDRPVRPDRRVALLVGLLVLLVACATRSTATPPPTPGPVDTPGASWAFDARPPSDWSGDTISAGDLPPEARSAFQLVVAGGPYPFRQDDGIFGNREGVLPDRPDGTYREYTVVTPGSSDRGARRLVIGDGRAMYWTDDHYATFRFVTP